MKLNKITILIFIAFCVFCCGKNDEKEEITPKLETTPKLDTTPKIETNLPQVNIVVDSAKAVKQSILRIKTFKRKEAKVKNSSGVVGNKKVTTAAKNTSEEILKSTINDNSFIYLKKILNNCKVGQKLTQKELSANLNIPKEAIKLVKSIEKISESEIDVKWKSSWLIEAVSDAKLKDGILKMDFKNGKMYTSGKAIGIKYDDKMYYDLVITGHFARIPTVKGYYWQIGKD